MNIILKSEELVKDGDKPNGDNPNGVKPSAGVNNSVYASPRWGIECLYSNPVRKRSRRG